MILPRVMGVIPVYNSHNPLVTPITLENPVRNSCNPGWNTLEIPVKEGGGVLFWINFM